MEYAAILTAAKALPRDEQIQLVHEIWDGIAEPNGKLEPLDEFTKRLLDERIADCTANPDDEMPLDQALAEIRAEIRK